MTAYRYGTAAAIVFALIIGAFFYGQHVANTANALAQAKAVAKAQAQADKLSADNATLTAKVTQARSALSQLNAAVAALPPTIRYVYESKPSTISRVTPTHTVITEPLFITVGMASLYDRSLGLPNFQASNVHDQMYNASISIFTLDNLETVTIENNGACYANTTQLRALQAKMMDLIHAGVVRIQ